MNITAMCSRCYIHIKVSYECTSAYIICVVTCRLLNKLHSALLESTANVTLYAFFFISHGLKRRIVLDDITRPLQNAQSLKTPVASSSLHRTLRARKLHCIMWYDFSTNSY